MDNQLIRATPIQTTNVSKHDNSSNLRDLSAYSAFTHVALTIHMMKGFKFKFINLYQSLISVRL